MRKQAEKKQEQVRPEGTTGEAGQGRTSTDVGGLKLAPFDGHNWRKYCLPMSVCVRIFPLVGRRPRRRPEGTP